MRPPTPTAAPHPEHADSTMLDLFPSREAGRFGRRLKQRARHAHSGHRGHRLSRRRQDHAGAPLPGDAARQNTAVIINEYGAVGIDDALLRDSSEEITLLGNGCLCCNTRSDLQLALRRLVAERERRTVPWFGRVVIETSGLADPGPILQTFATDRALGGEFFVEVVLAVVDCGGRPRNAGMVGGSAQAGDPRRPAGAHESRSRRTAVDRAAWRAIARAQSTRGNQRSGRGVRSTRAA